MRTCVCVCVFTVRLPAHGEVQHGVVELVFRLLLQLLTQTLQRSLVLNNTNSPRSVVGDSPRPNQRRGDATVRLPSLPPSLPPSAPEAFYLFFCLCVS